MATDWLVSRRKRNNRDIRDFIPVHGKILKPSPPSRHGDGEGKRKKQVPLAKLRGEERQSNNKVPATAFSTGVRRKVPLIEVHGNSSCPSVKCSSATTWEEKQKEAKVQEGKVDKENKREFNRKRARDKENKVMSLTRKRTAKKHSVFPNPPAPLSPSLLTTVVASTPLTLSSKSRSVDPTPSPSLLHSVAHSPPFPTPSPSLLHSVGHSPPLLGAKSPDIYADQSPSLLNTITPTPQPSRSKKSQTIVPPSVLNTIPSTPLTLGYKSPTIDPTPSPSLLKSVSYPPPVRSYNSPTIDPTPSPSLLRTKHTVAPPPFLPITTVTTSPGELFSPPDNENHPSNNEPPDEEFDCPLSCLSPETRALIEELESCEKLCDRLLCLT